MASCTLDRRERSASRGGDAKPAADSRNFSLARWSRLCTFAARVNSPSAISAVPKPQSVLRASTKRVRAE
jgi:hypothetical protein